MDGHSSGVLSAFVLNVLQRWAEHVGLPPSMFNELMVRKLAHFLQFALLGFLLTATIQCWFGKIKPHVFMILFCGLSIAVTDEFIQLFVDGRSSQVDDIILDFVGFIFGMLLYIGIAQLLRAITIKKQNPGKVHRAQPG